MVSALISIDEFNEEFNPDGDIQTIEFNKPTFSSEDQTAIWISSIDRLSPTFTKTSPISTDVMPSPSSGNRICAIFILNCYRIWFFRVNFVFINCSFYLRFIDFIFTTECIQSSHYNIISIYFKKPT